MYIHMFNKFHDCRIGTQAITIPTFQYSKITMYYPEEPLILY